LAFSRIMIFHKSLPRPSKEEESLIDQRMRDLVELAVKFTDASSSDFGSAQHQLATIGSGMANSNDKIFDLALQAIRLVHVRRTIAKVSGIDGETNESYADNYKLLLDRLPKTSPRKAFVVLDKLNALLAAEYHVRERKLAARSIRQLDNEALQVAKKYLETVKTFLQGSSDSDTTLFVSSTQTLSDDLFEETKVHFARAVSLYHSNDAHDLCAQWSDLLQGIIQLKQKSSMSLEDTDALLGQVMSLKAYALSMSGNHASGVSRWSTWLFLSFPLGPHSLDPHLILLSAATLCTDEDRP